jgi:hypothetical protein
MPDTFTTVTTKGYGSRVLGSVQGVLLGFLLFVVSFGVLYWNEGRVDVSSIAKKSVVADATVTPDGGLNGSFVSATGNVTSAETIGDTLYLKPGSYLSVNRKAEMYAWVEKSDSKSEVKTGGSETTTTTYNYVK